jgi:hypothetical protein
MSKFDELYESILEKTDRTTFAKELWEWLPGAMYDGGGEIGDLEKMLKSFGIDLSKLDYDNDDETEITKIINSMSNSDFKKLEKKLSNWHSDAELNENFKSDVQDLSPKELQKLSASPIDIKDAKFTKMHKDAALYIVLWYDDEDDEYNISELEVTPYVGGKYKLEYGAQPHERGTKKEMTKQFAKETK